MDEKHILARARRGELPAFEELVRRHEKRVYAVALRSSGSPEDAEDITQEVFLRAWRSIEEFRGDSGFSTWLFRITMNLCVDHARHKHAQPQTQPLVMGEEESERPLRTRRRRPRNIWTTASWGASWPRRWTRSAKSTGASCCCATCPA